MLWNIDGASHLQKNQEKQIKLQGQDETKEIEMVVDKSIEEMNLVQILSHGTDESGPPEESEES